MAYGSSFYGAGASSGGSSSYLGDMNLTPYLDALALLKTKRIAAGNSPTADYKTASIATDTARDTALAGLKTALNVIGTKTYVGKIYKVASPYPRAVRIYEFDSGELVDTAYPDDTGLFIFSNLAVGKYYVTAHDFGTISDPIIQTITIA